MFIFRMGFLKVRASACRMQQAIRAYLRNIHLEESSYQIFKVVRSGDIPSVSRYAFSKPKHPAENQISKTERKRCRCYCCTVVLAISNIGLGLAACTSLGGCGVMTLLANICWEEFVSQ